jgi:hypothetical protein
MADEFEFYDFSFKGLFGGKKKVEPTKISDDLLNKWQGKNTPLNSNEPHPYNDLNFPLIQFSDNPLDKWTLEDAVRGTQIFGGIGSGKSSGSGKLLALTFLKYGFGGLVLCGKPDERKNWEAYARATGRYEDLIFFDKTSGFEFNPLIYEQTRKGEGAGETSNMVNLYMNVFKLGQRVNGSQGKETSRFFENALRRLLSRTIDLLKLAGEELSIKNMIEVVTTSPVGEDYHAHIVHLAHEGERIGDRTLVEKFMKSGYCTSLIWKASDAKQRDQPLTVEEAETLQTIQRYFLRDLSTLAPETRSGVIESFYGITEPFQNGILKSQFSKGLNIWPEITFDNEEGRGKIIIIDYSVKKYLETGVYAQGIFKLLWQQAVERREIAPTDSAIPVFLWADESQFFVSEYDMMFQQTARSSRACTVFLTQNISNYYAMMGGESSAARVNSLLGNLSTKIFHANNDYITNNWAADTIGKDFKETKNMGMGLSLANGGMPNITGGVSNHLHYQVEPKEFTTLKGGGKATKEGEPDGIIDFFIITTGKDWSSNNGIANYKKIKMSREKGIILPKKA